MYIKGFDQHLRCRNVQFEIGKEYKIENGNKPLKLCSDTVFHFCDSLQKVHNFYHIDTKNRFCEIEVLGEIVSDDNKMGSNHIKIVREITGEELEILKGRVNGNTGLFNSSDCNSGDFNSGDFNSGDFNSGNYNSGDCNSGDCNSGNFNTGNSNSGISNTGNSNSGNSNSGDCNSGDFNSGNYNSGNSNSGSFNKCNNVNGAFNTKTPKIQLFNKPSNWTLNDFYNSIAYKILSQMPITKNLWILADKMTDEEKKAHPTYKTCGGYLKENIVTSDDVQKWWNELPLEEKKEVMSLPNFDTEIFKEITEISVK